MLGLLWSGALALAASPTAAGDTQSLESIRAAAESFVSARAGREGEQARAVAGELDRRLRLAQCGEALEAYLPPGGRVGANTAVGVRCRGPKPWKLFVPVRLRVTAPAYVAARYLSAGTVLSAADLRVEQMEVGRQRHVLRANEPVAGLVLRRDLPAGEPLRGNLLDAPTLVRRGQRVTLAASGGPVRIRMAGTAMGDGRKGQRIRVRNTSSGRIVEGVVRSADLVEIGLN